VHVALLVARALLAAVFVVAGLAKLADRAGSRQAVVGFGLPGGLAGPLAIVLPLAELATGAALLPAASAWWGAVAALSLLLLFVAAISLNLARGRRPACHCFGQLSSAPVGWPTLARNGVLAVIAGFIVWQGRGDPGPSVVGWLRGLAPYQLLGLVSGLVLLGVLVVEGLLLINLLRQNGRLLVRLETLEARLDTGVAPGPTEAPAAPEPGLPVGSPAPAFSLSGLRGEILTLDYLRALGKPTMLVFSDPGCGPCQALLPEIARWQREHAEKLTVALISQGSLKANLAKSAEHGLQHVLLQQDREIGEAYQEAGTPSAVLVRPDGMIGSPLAAGAEAIRAMVARSVGAPIPLPMAAPSSAAAIGNGNSSSSNGAAAAPSVPTTATIGVGQRAPALKLPDLAGRTISLAGLRGRKTLVLFWDPGCGFCQQMLDDLKAWEANPPQDAPKLLVVSTGSAEENRAMGLRSPVLLDQGFSAGMAFGANGTPSAILVDGKGKIASELAVGAPAVLALAGLQPGSTQQSTGSVAVAKLGEPAPALRLPDLTGKTVDLSDFRGRNTLVLFWNPGCGFCQQMLDDLKAWEANPPQDAPKLLVVSTGSAEENRAMGLRSPVLLDHGITSGSAFGANGTPMAVLVDAAGKIASEVAAGAPAVLSLARGKQA
jgi:thiol-disulfide isomerase/thioredoxin